MSTQNKLFRIFEHVTGVQPEEVLSQQYSKWDQNAAEELLQTIGQDNIKMISPTDGVSEGDWGRVKFSIVSSGALYLQFQTPEMAHMAINSLSDSATNPYEFSSRFDEMPTTVMVQFTDNGISEGDLVYHHATDAGPDQDKYEIGAESLGESTGIVVKKVKELKKGDVLSSGTILISDPVIETHPMYGKGKMRVVVKYPNGNEKPQVWNANTTIGVKVPEQLSAAPNTPVL